MRRLRWLAGRAGLLYKLARGPTELMSVTLYVLRFLVVSLLHLEVRDFRVTVWGIRFLIGAGETTSLGEVLQERCYEQLTDFVPKRGWTVVDVGANIGAFALLQASRGARVVAFEPNPDCFRRLARAARSNGFGSRLTIVERAVAEAPGHAELAVEAGNTLLGSTVHAPAGDRVQLIGVEVDSLDRALSALGMGHLDLLKLDAEGSEPDILRGAERTLERVDRIVLEYHSDVELAEVKGLMERAGFVELLCKPGTPIGGVLYFRSNRLAEIMTQPCTSAG